MSFEEYKASIGQTTDMTNNILAGSKSGMGKSRRDPRASYRGTRNDRTYSRWRN